ncbi:MAG: TM2 domain-containing protein [Bacillota bacterium]
MKSRKIAYLLWLVGVFGCLGLHRFYLGKTKTGLLWLCTGGVAGVGALADLFFLGEQVKQANNLLILEKLAKGEEMAELKKLLEPKKTARSKNDSYCPYCLGILDHQPKQNINCPFCLKKIYFRPKQRIFPGVLLIREDALVLDFVRKLKNFGIDELTFLKKREELTAGFGNEINSVDVLWSLLRQAMANTTDPVGLKRINTQTVALLKELHRNCFDLLQRALKMQLLEYRRDGYTKKVRIAGSNTDACPACRRLAGRIYTIDEALQTMPIPCKECSTNLTAEITGFCRCVYQAVD